MERASAKQERIAARRTYMLLRAALFAQLSKRPFEQITLTDICSTALVSRSTFYRYFEDKYDLLRYCLQSLLEESGLSDEVIYFRNMENIRRFLDVLLQNLNENTVMYQKIFQANKDGDLFRIIRRGLIQILTDNLLAAEQNGYRLKLSAPVYTSLLADFYFDIVKCYLEQADQMDCAAFIDSVCRFVERVFLAEREG